MSYSEHIQCLSVKVHPCLSQSPRCIGAKNLTHSLICESQIIGERFTHEIFYAIKAIPREFGIRTLQ